MMDSYIDMPTRRMKAKDKRQFRVWLVKTIKWMVDSPITIQKGWGGKNVIVGNPKTAKTIVGAHYDTPPQMPAFFMRHLKLWGFVGFPLMIYGLMRLSMVLPLWLGINGQPLVNYYLSLRSIYLILNLMVLFHVFGFTPFDNKSNDNDNSSGVKSVLNVMRLKWFDPDICYVFFDNEEKFLLGSLMYRLRYNKYLKHQQIIILDCIATGDGLTVVGNKKKPLVRYLLEMGNRFVQDDDLSECKQVRTSIFRMSDQGAFWGLDTALILGNDISRIHTKYDYTSQESLMFSAQGLVLSVVN
jgi:hypothetical protein